MFKILLADNEGVVLNSLRNMIYSHLGETCDVRTARTAPYLRRLARKFIPDIAIINIEMPDLRSFDIIQEIRSYDIRCVFITLSTYDRQSYRTEVKNLHILSHVRKPLFREKILPPIEKAVSIVDQMQKRQQKTNQIQQKLDIVIPLLEQGLISQLFFSEENTEILHHYLTLLNLPQRFAKPIRLTFGDKPPKGSEDTLTNEVGATIRLNKYYIQLREVILSYFPLALCSSLLSNHLFFLLPCWKLLETPAETQEFQTVLAELLEKLEEEFDTMCFFSKVGEIDEFTELQLSDLL